jgi:cytoplasmic iron level regulating protein YaaA (DUF328/UPF0246 family)
MNLETVDLPVATQPEMLDKSIPLASKLRRFSKTDLMALMEISESLATLNQKRFKDWKPPFTPTNAKQAIYTFSGDVYDGLSAATLESKAITFAQDHLRILSGLYGLLRPLDLIQPYRLEMGRPLATAKTKNLYGYWRETITTALNAMQGDLLVNLASREYSKAVDPRALNKQIVSPVFKDEKKGAFKVISFYAKKARGAMARYIVENQIVDLEGLLSFSSGGYCFNPELSTDNAPTFTRSERLN